MNQFDADYIRRNAEYYRDAELLDMESLSPEWRIEIDGALGHATHRARHRVRSTEYDWPRLDAWMREHRVSNETMVVLFDMVYHRRISQGTVACIRAGYYTYSRTVREMMGMMEG